MGTVGLAVAGTDLETFGRITSPYLLFLATAPRGNYVVAPARPGAVHVPKVADVGVITAQMTVGAGDPAALQATLRDMRSLLFDTDTTLDLTRTVAYPDGTVTTTAVGEWLPSAPVAFAPGYARWALDFNILEGGFYGPQQSTTLTSGGSTTVDNTGDDRTRKVTLAFSGGGPYVLTNTTTGRVLNVPVGTVTVDVWAPTVTSGGLSVLGSTSKSGDAAEAFLFALAKDNNSLSLSGGGQVVVSWQPVYL